MRKYEPAEPEVTVVSDKGQIVIPSYLRNKLGLKPRSKLLVYNVQDSIILRKLTVPDVKKEMRELWRKIDRRIAEYGEMTEEEIQSVIEKANV